MPSGVNRSARASASPAAAEAAKRSTRSAKIMALGSLVSWAGADDASHRHEKRKPDARAPTQLRVLQQGFAGRRCRRPDLFLRMHVLQRVCDTAAAWRALPQLWRRAGPAAGAAGRKAGALPSIDGAGA